MSCPCEASESFENCCSPYLSYTAHAPTAEKLMRSRYTAFTRGDVNYIKNTLAPESKADFDMASTKEWIKQATWKGLKILSTKSGTEKDKVGTVEFHVTYAQGPETFIHHETAQFRKNNNDHWLFVEGDAHTHKEGEEHHHRPKQETIVRDAPKIGRNDPCPCGSGKKYKKCCGT